MKSMNLAGAIVAGVVIVAVGGFVAGARISSPAEVALRTKAPVPSPILVPVEERVLSANVVTRGTGRFGSPQKLAVSASALKTNAGLVGELPPVGVALGEGDVAATVSGRPVFVLVGARPMSRDLGPGVRGDDVRQLEDALVRLGFNVGSVDGAYDEAAAAGVAAWYRSKGFAPFEATADQIAAAQTRDAAVTAAAVDVIAADGSVIASQASLDAARSAVVLAEERARSTAALAERARDEADAEYVGADADVGARQVALDAVRAGTVSLPATAAQLSVAVADLAGARASSANVKASTSRALSDAQVVVDRAPGLLDAAMKAAAAANLVAQADLLAKQAAVAAARVPPVPAEGQIVDLARVSALVAAAEADLITARANVENVRTTGDQRIAEAQATFDQAPGLLDEARSLADAARAAASRDVEAKEAALTALRSPSTPTPPSQSEIATAERELVVATVARETTRRAGERAQADASTTAAEAAFDVSAKRGTAAAAVRALANASLASKSRTAVLDQARADAKSLRRRAGVQVPADEVVFVTNSPVRVSKLLVGPGDFATGGIMMVTDSKVRVDGGLAVKDARLVRSGMTARISEPDLGIDTHGIVTVLAAAPGTNGVDGFHVYFEIDVPDPPTTLIGASVRLSIPVSSTGRAVLAVPLSALTLAPDGTSRVQRQAGRLIENVVVEAGLSADGYVAVTPLVGTLEAGDLVFVGFDLPPTEPATTPGTTPAITPGTTVA